MSDGAIDAAGDDDANVVLATLRTTGAKGLAVTVSVVHRSIEVACFAAAATGFCAVTLGWWAWHQALPGALLACASGAVTLAAAGYVFLRVRALAAAIKHPTETMDQAQDLVLRAKGSPELHRLASAVRTRQAGRAARATASASMGKARRAMRMGRLVSRVIGLASPDPERHRYLTPFTPDRLKNLWLAVLVGLWAWLVSAAIASLALLSLAIGAL